MQAIDAEAIEAFGIPRLLLMEHAGLAVAQAARGLCRARPHRVVVCAGTGYNGGDGLAAARHLHGWGYPVAVVLAGRVSGLRAEPGLYAAVLRRLGVPLMEGERNAAEAARRIRGCALLIDALLGIGAHGPPREPVASLIIRMNASGKPIVAVDVPSGLDADTGAVGGAAINAAVTVTFGLRKRGCLRGEGPAHTGALVVDPITLPPLLLRAA